MAHRAVSPPRSNPAVFMSEADLTEIDVYWL
jgi:hypothetical protein